MSKPSTESEKKAFTKELMRRASEGMGREHNEKFKSMVKSKKKKMAGKMGRAPSKKEMKKFNSEQPDDYRYKHLHD